MIPHVDGCVFIWETKIGLDTSNRRDKPILYELGEKGSGEGRGEGACRGGVARGVHNGCGLTSTMFTRSTEAIYTLYPLTSTTTTNDNRDRIYGYDIIHAAYGISNNLDIILPSILL